MLAALLMLTALPAGDLVSTTLATKITVTRTNAASSVKELAGDLELALAGGLVHRFQLGSETVNPEALILELGSLTSDLQVAAPKGYKSIWCPEDKEWKIVCCSGLVATLNSSTDPNPIEVHIITPVVFAHTSVAPDYIQQLVAGVNVELGPVGGAPTLEAISESVAIQELERCVASAIVGTQLESHAMLLGLVAQEYTLIDAIESSENDYYWVWVDGAWGWVCERTSEAHYAPTDGSVPLSVKVSTSLAR